MEFGQQRASLFGGTAGGAYRLIETEALRLFS